MHEINNYYTARCRKLNVQGTSAEIAQLDKMFPPGGIRPRQYGVLYELQQYFDPKKHYYYLVQQCFKNHYNFIREIYQQFRAEKYPQITEPRVSTIYENQSFLTFKELTDWLRIGSEQKYPTYMNKSNPSKVLLALNLVHDQLNYVPNLQRFLTFFPDYFWKFSTYHTSLIQPKVIDTKIAYMLLIFVAIEMACPYMLTRACSLLINQGAPKAWILQNRYPKQICSLFIFIRKACKAPWEITADDYQYLKNKQWANNDLLIHQHIILWGVSACTMALALGLEPDQPCPLFDIEKMMEIKKKYDSIIYEEHPDKEKILAQVKYTLETHENLDSKEIKQLQNKQIEPYMKAIGKQLDEQNIYKEFVQLTYGIYEKEFIKTEKRDEHNFPFQYRQQKGFTYDIAPQLITFLGEEIGKNFQNLMKSSIVQEFETYGDTAEEKKNFKLAVRYYAENLMGIKHQNYDYKKMIKMNKLLTIPLRFYIKLVINHPVYIKKQVIDGIGHCEGRKQLYDLGYITLLVTQTKSRVVSTTMYNYLYSPSVGFESSQ